MHRGSTILLHRLCPGITPAWLVLVRPAFHELAPYLVQYVVILYSFRFCDCFPPLTEPVKGGPKTGWLEIRRASWIRTSREHSQLKSILPKTQGSCFTTGHAFATTPMCRQGKEAGAEITMSHYTLFANEVQWYYGTKVLLFRFSNECA